MAFLPKIGLGLNRPVSSGIATQNLCQYSFDGISKYMNFGNILDSVLTGASPTFTIGMWVKRKSNGVNHSLLSKWESGTGNQLGFDLRWKLDNTLTWLQTSNGQSGTVQGCTTVDSFSQTDEWTHIVFTLDYTAASYTLAGLFYVNGEHQNCTATSIVLNPIHQSTTDMLLGASLPSAPFLFADVDIRDIVINDIVLTPTEIKDWYNEGNLQAPSPTNLVFHANFKTDTFSTNWTVEDLSGNNYDGTTVNVLEGDRTCSDVELYENRIGAFDNSVTYDTGLRSTVSEFNFNYSGTQIWLEAAVTGADNIDVYEDGVYTQSVTMVDGINQLVTLSPGAKLVTLTESVVSNDRLNGVKLTSVVVTPSQFTNVNQGSVVDRFVFLGDSITQGQGATNRTREGFSELFRYTDGKPVTVLGYSGAEMVDVGSGAELTNTLGWITEAFQNTTGRKVLTIMLGTNDFAVSRPATNVDTAYKALIDGVNANDSDIEIFVVTPTIRTDDAALLDTYRANQVTMCSTRAFATSIDGKSILVVGDLTDVVHPSTAGHLKIHDAIDSIIL